MNSAYSYIYRGDLVESRHKAAILIKNSSKKIIFSSDNNHQYIYPRSAIKIFQAIPFIKSKADILYGLNKKHISISCSSHSGESYHIKTLKEWVSKIRLNVNKLQCGIHNPMNLNASNKLYSSGNKPSELHNNCAGKHLAMISGCIASNFDYTNYLDISHPYQIQIKECIEHFMEKKITKKYSAIDGCNAPQYALPLNNIANSMINLIHSYNHNAKYSNELKKLITSIKKYPMLTGGINRFDSDLLKNTNGRIYAKIGAEGVLLFADLSKKIGGVIKIIDGNGRAIPSIAMKILIKLKLLSNKEKKMMQKWNNEKIHNFSKTLTGKISAKID